MANKTVGKVQVKISSCFEWKISQFSSFLLNGGDACDSPKFTFCDANWTLEIIRGRNEIIGVRLNKQSTTCCCADTYNQQHVIVYKLSLITGDDTEYIPEKGECNFSEDRWPSKRYHYFNKSKLSWNNLTLSDDLTISCAIICSRCIEKVTSPEILQKHGGPALKRKYFPDADGKDAGLKKALLDPTGINKLMEDLENLLRSGEGSDVSLKVSDRIFRAHTTILRARAPVFYSEISQNRIESPIGTIDISGCQPQAFQHFLEYLYLGYTENLSSDSVSDLYFIADKYDVTEVKKMCVEFMTSNLSVETFHDVLELSLQYSESVLLQTSIAFFARNMIKIIETDQWLSFLKENPVEANELHKKALDYYVSHK